MSIERSATILREHPFRELTAKAIGRLVALGNHTPESQLLGRTLVAGHNPNEIALTYDDGPNTHSTPELLEVLGRADVRATFFLIGKFVRGSRELVRSIHRAGHLIGNHTMTHPCLASMTSNAIEHEIRDCSSLLEDVIGAPVRYFRPPYGARRPAVLRAARRLGLEPVQWNVEGNDWEPINADKILQKLESGLCRVRCEGRSANVLLHDGFDRVPDYDRSETVRATELLLLYALKRGYRTATVDAWR